jgi:hypothetical protein
LFLVNMQIRGDMAPLVIHRVSSSPGTSTQLRAGHAVAAVAANATQLPPALLPGHLFLLPRWISSPPERSPEHRRAHAARVTSAIHMPSHRVPRVQRHPLRRDVEDGEPGALLDAGIELAPSPEPQDPAVNSVAVTPPYASPSSPLSSW